MKKNIKKLLKTKNLGFKIKGKKNKKYLYILSKKFVKLNIYLNKKNNIFLNKIYIKKKKDYNTFIKFIKNKFIEAYLGFYVDLLIKGIGYTVYVYKNYLYFNLGFSHYIFIKIPKLIKVLKFKKRIVLYSFDKNILNKFIYKLYSFRGLDIYKGQGIVNKKIKIKLKEGKKKK